jgi:hypothetical protein
MDAEEFYRGARAVLVAIGNYDYAIHLYLGGLEVEPDNVEAHQALREIGLERAAKGERPLGMFEKAKLDRVLKQSGADAKKRMLAAERLLAYDPGQRTYMFELLQHATAGGFHATADWVLDIIRRSGGQP